MLSAMWSGLGGRVADTWAGLLSSPALGFWIGGVLAWVIAHGGLVGAGSGWPELQAVVMSTFGSMPTAGQAIVAVVLLLGVAGSARIGEALLPGALRVLEGYWPRPAAPLRRSLVIVRGYFLDRRLVRWRDLAQRRTRLTATEWSDYVALTAWRVTVPPAPRDRMPTKLGDALRAAESRPEIRYGLDAVVCWPHLWLVMPEQARIETSAARRQLDDGVRLWLWSLLFIVWVVFTWWALPVAVGGMAVGCRLALIGATTYGQLVQASFDVHRRSLYEAMGWSFPADPRDEHLTGERLTAYLQRGPALDHPQTPL